MSAVDAKLRVGAVSYLNARPLVLGFEQGVASDRITLSYDVPSALADRMERGEFEIALLPAIELARIPDLTVVPGLAIGSYGPCRSVLLVAKRPLDAIRRLALDPESRTSNVLAEILLRERGEPECLPGPRDLDDALAEADAAVRIGDKALFEPTPKGTTAHDLGAIWTERTGLPFVFAVWAALPTIVDRSLYRAFHRSRGYGAKALDAIAEDYEYQGKRYPEIARAYLKENIRYRLGSAELEALRRFHRTAYQWGLIEEPHLVRPMFWPETESKCATP